MHKPMASGGPALSHCKAMMTNDRDKARATEAPRAAAALIIKQLQSPVMPDTGSAPNETPIHVQ
jgi:hypothetical protein